VLSKRSIAVSRPDGADDVVDVGADDVVDIGADNVVLVDDAVVEFAPACHLTVITLITVTLAQGLIRPQQGHI